MIIVEITNPLSRSRTEKSRAATTRHMPRSVAARIVAHDDDHLAEQLGQRGPHQAEVPDLADRAGEIEHALVVDVVRELDDHAAGHLGLEPHARDRLVPIRPARPRPPRGRAGAPATRGARRSRPRRRSGRRRSSRRGRTRAPRAPAGGWRTRSARPAIAPFAIQHLDQDVGADRVETRERLVEDEDVGLVHERGGELHALLVPERQALDPVLRRDRPRRGSRGSPGRGSARLPGSTPCSRAR